MEPKPKTGVKPKVIVRAKVGHTTKSTDNSGGKQVAAAHRKSGSHVTPPIAPPRLKSRSGGHVVKSDNTRQRMKK